MCGTAPYCAAKGGVQMMTKALANDWGKYDITVNCIAPGYFPSELTAAYIDSDAFTQLHKDRCPKSRHGLTGEMDGLCVYFASTCCSYTTGQTVAVDGRLDLHLSRAHREKGEIMAATQKLPRPDPAYSSALS